MRLHAEKKLALRHAKDEIDRAHGLESSDRRKIRLLFLSDILVWR
jgi:hypothetical protein